MKNRIREKVGIQVLKELFWKKVIPKVICE